MRVSAIEGHQLWAPVYNVGANAIVALERRTMRRLLRSVNRSTVIDVGCGTGEWLSYFHCQGSTVFGCDACAGMLLEAAKDPSLRSRIALADAEAIPFGDAIADLVLCSLCLAYFPSVARVFREFARTLRMGGTVAVSDVHPDALLSGWTRSFKLDCERYEIDHYVWSVREIDAAAVDAGLRPRLSVTAYFDSPELPLFQLAGKEDLFENVKKIPALFVGLWEKTC